MKQELQQKIDTKTKPIGSLGKLETIALKIGVIQQSLCPKIKKPTIILFAGDHGITQEGVSAFPSEVTPQMVLNFEHGGAAVNVLTELNHIDLFVADLGVNYDFEYNEDIHDYKVRKSTRNMLHESAMTDGECNKAIDNGRIIVQNLIKSGVNCIGLGEMGIGNTSSAALLLASFTDLSIEECVGKGTGLDDKGLEHKKQILSKVFDRHFNPDLTPVEKLTKMGGYEIAGMIGAILEAKKNKITILIDGFISSAAALVASKINPSVLDNCIFCHQSQEKTHRIMLENMKVEGLIDLNMRLGEGSGIAVAFPIIKASIAFLNEMASFEDAGVTNK